MNSDGYPDEILFLLSFFFQFLPYLAQQTCPVCSEKRESGKPTCPPCYEILEQVVNLFQNHFNEGIAETIAKVKMGSVLSLTSGIQTYFESEKYQIPTTAVDFLTQILSFVRSLTVASDEKKDNDNLSIPQLLNLFSFCKKLNIPFRVKALNTFFGEFLDGIIPVFDDERLRQAITVLGFIRSKTEVNPKFFSLKDKEKTMAMKIHFCILSVFIGIDNSITERFLGYSVPMVTYGRWRVSDILKLDEKGFFLEMVIRNISAGCDHERAFPIGPIVDLLVANETHHLEGVAKKTKQLERESLSYNVLNLNKEEEPPINTRATNGESWNSLCAGKCKGCKETRYISGKEKLCFYCLS